MVRYEAREECPGVQRGDQSPSTKAVESGAADGVQGAIVLAPEALGGNYRF